MPQVWDDQMRPGKHGERRDAVSRGNRRFRTSASIRVPAHFASPPFSALLDDFRGAVVCEQMSLRF